MLVLCCFEMPGHIAVTRKLGFGNWALMLVLCCFEMPGHIIFSYLMVRKVGFYVGTVLI